LSTPREQINGSRRTSLLFVGIQNAFKPAV
jgi:hypothetical protein